MNDDQSLTPILGAAVLPFPDVLEISKPVEKKVEPVIKQKTQQKTFQTINGKLRLSNAAPIIIEEKDIEPPKISVQRIVIEDDNDEVCEIKDIGGS